jgi:Ca2+-binding EF-hand superfamily protein
MNNKREITEADLVELLQDNDVTNFDPVYEAFRAYDTEGEGTISLQRLRDVFTAFGLGELSATEVEILTRVRIIFYLLLIKLIIIFVRLQMLMVMG